MDCISNRQGWSLHSFSGCTSGTTSATDGRKRPCLHPFLGPRHGSPHQTANMGGARLSACTRTCAHISNVVGGSAPYAQVKMKATAFTLILAILIAVTHVTTPGKRCYSFLNTDIRPFQYGTASGQDETTVWSFYSSPVDVLIPFFRHGSAGGTRQSLFGNLDEDIRPFQCGTSSGQYEKSTWSSYSVPPDDAFKPFIIAK